MGYWYITCISLWHNTMRPLVYRALMCYRMGATVLLLSLLACGDDNGPTRPKDGKIEITLSSFEFEPSEIELYPGERVTLTLISIDEAHTFTIDGLDMNVSVPALQTVTAEINVSSVDTYPYYCAMPGHREQGMAGVLTVARRPVTQTSSSGVVGY